jgi:hypothetical protein
MILKSEVTLDNVIALFIVEGSFVGMVLILRRIACVLGKVPDIISAGGIVPCRRFSDPWVSAFIPRMDLIGSVTNGVSYS